MTAARHREIETAGELPDSASYAYNTPFNRQ